jgi:hypothetical protein
MPAPTSPGAARSRLAQAPQAYRLALDVADRLDQRGLDLWAAGLRACLDAPGSTARQHHLAVELIRLSCLPAVRAAGLAPALRDALDHLQAGLGPLDVPAQPLYAAARDLAEHLEVEGGRRWLARLRAVALDDEHTAAARLRRLTAVLQRMRDVAVGGHPAADVAPGDALPVGTTPRVDAVLGRIPRHRDADEAATYLAFALQPPQPSRRAARPRPGDVLPV